MAIPNIYIRSYYVYILYSLATEQLRINLETTTVQLRMNYEKTMVVLQMVTTVFYTIFTITFTTYGRGQKMFTYYGVLRRKRNRKNGVKHRSYHL